MKLTSIIKEEIGAFLNEREFADTDIVDASNINLYDEYNKLNTLLFDGKLPKVMMKWSNRKGNLGHVNAIRNRTTGEVQINYLAISSFHSMPYRIFKDTLAHEMIHIWQYVVEKIGSHGSSFYKQMNRINGMGLGFNISVVSHENLDVSDKVKSKAKTLIVFIFDIDGKYFFLTTTPNAYAAEPYYVFDLFRKIVNSGKCGSVNITVVESDNPELLKVPLTKVLKKASFAYYKLPDDLRNALSQDKVIKSVKIEKGSPVIWEQQSPNSSENWEDISISEDNSENWEDISIS